MSEVEFDIVFESGERARDDGCASVVSEEISVEDDVLSVRSLEALLRLESISQSRGGDHACCIIADEFFEVILQGISLKSDLGFFTLNDQVVGLVLADSCAVDICVTGKPYRKVAEVELCELTHVRFLIHHEVADPLVVSREDVERSSSDCCVERMIWSEIFIYDRFVLDEYVVIDSIVSVKDRHEACDFGPVADVVWSITRFALTVFDTVDTGIDKAESAEDQVMYDSDTFTRDRYGNVRQEKVIIDESWSVTYFDKDVSGEHRTLCRSSAFRPFIVVHEVL